MRTWKVIQSGDGFNPTDSIFLECPHCGLDAEMPYKPMDGNPVIAAMGLALIFDRNPKTMPHRVLPKEVQCRQCRRVFVHDEKECFEI